MTKPVQTILTHSTQPIPAPIDRRSLKRWSPHLWRRLLTPEHAFVCAWFGQEQGSWLAARVRLGQRRLGDTRRALCLNGGWMSLPASCFHGQSMRHALRLEQPSVAGLFAHELLHEVQRHQGIAVTRQALWLHCQWLLQGKDPYCYSCLRSPRAVLRQFWLANVEQQGQMWQDCVQAVVAGQALASHALLPLAVREGRLRRIK